MTDTTQPLAQAVPDPAKGECPRTNERDVAAGTSKSDLPALREAVEEIAAWLREATYTTRADVLDQAVKAIARSEQADRMEETSGREWFWRVIDAAGLADVPSVEEAALRLLVGRSDRLSAAEARADRLEAALTGLIGSVLAARLHNTREYMEGLQDDLNKAAEAMGDTDRAAFNGDGFRILRAALSPESKEGREHG